MTLEEKVKALTRSRRADMDLVEYLRSQKPGPFRPLPYRNEVFGSVVWFWKDERAVSEPIHHEGEWVGSVYRNDKGEIVGVQIHNESVQR